MKRALVLLLILGLSPFGAGALRYLPANDAQPLLRRDLLPLDVDAIHDLAEQLAIIVDGPFPNSAGQLRHRAQALTLSQRLQPSQPRARDIEAASLKQSDRPTPQTELPAATAAILGTADWLTLLPNDSEGHHLGQLLLDVLQPLNPDHPVLQRRQPEQSAQRWNPVLPGVSHFEFENKPSPTRPKNPESNHGTFAISALLTEIPMISKGEEENSTPAAGLVTTSLVVTQAPFLEPEDEDAEPTTRDPGRLLFKPETDYDLEPLHQSLIDFFNTHLQPLPTHHNLNINTSQRQYLARNHENIAAPIAMMLDSAITGRPLRRNTILFARLRPNGTLDKPAHAWELLLRLDELKLPAKSRLIVGTGMIQELTALLVLDKASFFNQFEVLEAPTFQDARTLYFEDGTMPPELQAASDGYREVREKADLATNLATFLSLASVEKRLAAASQQSPHHLSAKLLATQTIRRPAYFSREMAARDLDHRLETLSRFHFVIDQTTEKDLENAYKEARAAIDPIERLLTLSDRKLYDEAANLLKKLNSVGRRAATTAPDNPWPIWQDDLNAFQAQLQAFRESLRKIHETTPIKNE